MALLPPRNIPKDYRIFVKDHGPCLPQVRCFERESTQLIQIPMQDRVECAAKDSSSAHGAIPGSLHPEKALHDCDRISAGRINVRPFQAGQFWAGGRPHPEEGGGAWPGLCKRHAVPPLKEVSFLAHSNYTRRDGLLDWDETAHNIALNPAEPGWCLDSVLT